MTDIIENMAVRAAEIPEQITLASDRFVDGEREWIDEWRAVVCDGDVDAFEHRLDLSGWSETALPDGQLTEWPEGESLPEWTETVEELITHVRQEEYTADEPLPAWAEGVPFADILLTFVNYAAGQLDHSGAVGDLSDEARDEFKRWLLERLKVVSSHPLFIEFKTFLAGKDEALAFGEKTASPDETRYYVQFVEKMYEDELESFLVEYAVLTRLLSTFVDQWVIVVEEFASRLRADRELLATAFGEPELGAIEEVSCSGDVHNAGRLVFGLTFETGVKVAYKPRSIETEKSFNDFLDWINQRSDLPEFRRVECLSRGEYGWMEWVHHEPCESTQEVERYFHRSGMLLCVLYALNFTDGHLENLISEGEHPVFVDLETLLQPPEPPTSKTFAEDVGQLFIEDTVLRTHLLPLFVPSADIRHQQGLASDRAIIDAVERQTFEHENTDAMELLFESPIFLESNNLPVLDGDSVDPKAYHEEIKKGFTEAYEFFLAQKSALLGEESPLELFEGTTIRYLIRSSGQYGKVLYTLKSASYLRNGVEADCKIESLAHPFTVGDISAEMWPVYEVERTALWRHDIPRFTVAADGTALDHPLQSIPDVFERTPLENLYDKIESFDRERLEEQLEYIDLAYTPRKFSHPDPPAAGADPDGPVDDERLERVALEVYDRLREHEAENTEGVVYWPMRENQQGGIYLPRMPDNFYSGRVGIATFVAALAALFDAPEYRQYVETVLEPTLDELDEDVPFESTKLGGTLGVGSIIYGFTKVGELLEDDRYVRAAERVSRTITTDRLADGNQLDPHRGSAGVIHGLLALYDHTGDTTVLDRAVLAGEHLVSYRTDGEGLDAWGIPYSDLDDEFIIRVLDADPGDSGYRRVSHGSDGIIAALFRLDRHTPDAQFRDVAQATLEYGCVDLERSPWPELRIQQAEKKTNGWCDGRVGQGLARLSLYELTNDDDLLKEALTVANDATTATPVAHDNVYSGNALRIEHLLQTSEVTGETMYEDNARELAAVVLDRFQERGRFTVPWQTEMWYNPSFFSGESGVGYSLLRLAEPSLPNVLAWE